MDLSIDTGGAQKAKRKKKTPKGSFQQRVKCSGCASTRKVVAFSFFEPMSEKEAKRGGLKGLKRREDMIRRNYFTGIRYVLRARKSDNLEQLGAAILK